MASATDSSDCILRIVNAAAKNDVLLVCEHASNNIPDSYDGLGLTDSQRQTHIAWDPGAEALTRALSTRLDATAVLASVSRLVYDLNRAPDAPNAITRKSEIHDVPGNVALTAAQRQDRVAQVYLPFHAGLRAQIAMRLAVGRQPVLVTVHSFTPVWYGQPRAVEIGVLHDSDARLAGALLPRIRAQCGYLAEMNAPYSAADHVTHTLRLHALPYGLLNVMLEIRNDLLGSARQVESIADVLAPALLETVADVQTGIVARQQENAPGFTPAIRKGSG